MSVQSVALASLTATYTDSEGDEGPEDEHHHHHHHHHHHRHQRRESSDTSKVDDTQNSNVAPRDSPPLFGRSTTNSPDDDFADDDPDIDDDDDDDENDEVRHHHHRNIVVNESRITTSNNRSTSKFSTNAPTLVTDVTSKVQRLVSYFDDTVVSDDETGTATAYEESNNSTINVVSDVVDNTSMKKNMSSSLQSPKRHGELISDCDEDGWGVTIPPEPSGQCPTELQEKITNLYKKMESGLDMNIHIQQRKEFRNPSIYEKLIQFCSINEMGTNYPPDRFDPFKWGKDSYYEELARIQKNEMDKLDKARKEKTKIEIVTGTAKRPNSNATNSEDDAKRRKSKWDQVATGTNASVKSNVVVSQPTLTTLTSSATGTKATVISAFGSLPKKRL